MLKLINAPPRRKICQGKKRVFTPALVPSSPKNSKKNLKPRIVKIEKIFGKVKIQLQKKFNEEESFLFWKLIFLKISPTKRTRLSKLSLKTEDFKKRRKISFRWHVKTKDEFLKEKKQPLKRKEAAVQTALQTNKAGSQAEPATKEAST
ncbi:hypothetical protein PUN28_008246 [Cardiocondyla obscurior]|uniref:Uncharacterized protein n=1 Tax=Cardiocondyla obscurior TaxID=286306 RepID=A0AAW2G053_9HYME